jgi:hypothetical protein
MNFFEEGRLPVLACMSSLVKTTDSTMTYQIAPCQRMSDKEIGDCGVLAIAFATAIANDKDPIQYQFNGNEIRKHLFNCFVHQEMTIFPGEKRRSTSRIPSRKIPVYCYCRRIDFTGGGKDWDLIECDKCEEWFHRMCVEDYPAKPKKVKWYCTSCK